MRLDHLLYRHYFESKKNVTRLLQRKRITVDGVLATDLKQNVDPHLQHIMVDGKHLYPETSHVYYMLNKPIGVVCANSDTLHSTVIDLIQPCDQQPNLYAVGRLDRDTEGLLLITDNGPLGYRLLHPHYHIEKTYAVTTLEPLEEADIQHFMNGIIFHDGTVCRPAKLTIIDAHHANVTIREGKFHQVKKMFLSTSKKITSLKRIAFGDLHLDPSLQAGDYRPLNTSELQVIKQYLD